ncbi:glycosyltransferase [Nonomuraea sp. bgisy101]|uniref:glycosyltransferase n=1 Tax=Nonomuraea sp. bgisy101 TaxID=3413784 RepID=UPI003D7428EA
MKVLHVITGLAAGGAEQQLRALLPYMNARCEVAVLTGLGVMAEAIRKAGVPVHQLDMHGNRDVRAVGRLARLMRAGRYEVVHAHLYRACVYGRLAARLANVPAIVATEHSIGYERIEGRRITMAIRQLYLASELLGHTTVAVSRAVADRLVAWGIPRSRIVVIANGIDGAAFGYDPRLRQRTRAALGLPMDTFVVGGVGRLEHGKRFDLLIEAMKSAGDAEDPRMVLLLVGAGSLRRRLEALARAIGVERRVIFTGESADMRGMLSAMDVLAAPSEEETFGLAAVEALAAGLPVLYGTCPAIDDLPRDAAPGARRVTQGELGAEIRALAAARPARLAPPGAVRLYDIRHQVDQLEALYRRLLGATANKE